MRMRPAAVLTLVLACGCQETSVQPQPLPGANAGGAVAVMERVGCGACHQIPGVRWPKGRVGPSLEGFADQALIAGRLANQPEHLVEFLRDAPSVVPGSGMPPMPITDQEARDVAAYLYTLHAQ